ncbi:MAG: DUF302 domain-containing protein [Gammaproteobacteria bacterium]|nr:DUF302 domain-containing protein [Gammaproteobacteria bacterium]MDH5660257.1 DUF302 domain-containing protein [Gammaproteobacteria bacterium]
MKYNAMIKIIISFFLLFFIITSHAEELMMARTKQTFPEAMLKLQETIREFGYTISRVQRIDIGLTKSGYATDKYRIVFFGTDKEISLISKKYPHLIPYIPWKIAIFAEQQDTLLVTADPTQFSDKKYPGADIYLSKWKKDLQKILNILRESE